VVDAPLPDDGGVVVVRCVAGGVLVTFSLTEPVNPLGDEAETLDEFGNLACLEDRAVDAVRQQPNVRSGGAGVGVTREPAVDAKD